MAEKELDKKVLNCQADAGPAEDSKESVPGTSEEKLPEHEQPNAENLSVDEQLTKIKEERDSWKEKAGSFWDQYLRALVEMENFRKRVARDIEDRVFREKPVLFWICLKCWIISTGSLKLGKI